MSIKSALSKPLALLAEKKVNKWRTHPIDSQHKVLRHLVKKGRKTAFGRDHDFDSISGAADFRKHVPIADYEALKPYIERAVKAEPDVLWPGLPMYFSKTSGTTSGAKYIPITKESMPHHTSAAKNALLLYIAETGNTRFVDGNMIFLQGSPVLKKVNGINTGRLSGIVAHHVPRYLQKNRLPSFETNSIDDWETKVDAIVRETVGRPMTLISGIPSWVQHYFEKLLTYTKADTVKEVFPDFELFVYGGVNFEPYRARFDALIGGKVDSIETYPASEGFIAFQDRQNDPALLLNVDAGMYFEFIPSDRYFDENPLRLSLEEVEVGVNYAIVLSTDAGLWGYSLGDTVKFTSLTPYKLLVTGRIKHFTSAFGEHVIAEEVEGAMNNALAKHPGEVIEFTVAPQLHPTEGLPHHEWLIAFGRKPENMEAFQMELDRAMQEKNIYYRDLIVGKILRPLEITSLGKDAFNRYMKSKGKLGGQNKVPRLSNDRSIADAISEWRESR